LNLEIIYGLQLCPACGYQLDFKPWDNRFPSDEICPCCGIQFGYDDATPGRREPIYEEWRSRWIADGCKWWSGRPLPPEFDPDGQLKRLASIASA